LQFTQWLFDKSFLDNSASTLEWIRNFEPGDEKKLTSDVGYSLSLSLQTFYNLSVLQPYQKYSDKINLLQRQYMAAQREAFPEKKFYPDANLTLRVAHGKVAGYEPKDGIAYQYFTTVEGIPEKLATGNEFYEAPPQLLELFSQKDFGMYASKNGMLHTCFIASNHTTGGNSGSPVLNAEGHLIGINFDRCWEGTMSDVSYDADLCRNISVDIRYVLFVADKFAGAGYLLNEMNLVKN
jgi:hypothetical protein